MDNNKKEFIKNFSNTQKPTDIKDAVILLNSYLKKAKDENISFTKEERDELIHELTKNLSLKEKEQIQKIVKLFN